MRTTAYSSQFKAELIQQAIENGACPKALSVAHELSPEVMLHWLRLAADGIPEFVTNANDRAPTRNSTRHFKTLFETSNDAIMLLTETGFFDCNPRTLKMFGIKSVDDFVRLHPADLSPPTQPDGRRSLDAANERIMWAMQTGSNNFEWVHRRLNGEDFEADVLLSRYEESGRQILQATVRDISAFKRVQRELASSHAELACAHAAAQRYNYELERLCMTDQLTGLFNRRKLDAVLQEECQLAQRHGRDMAVILADFDHFKRVNDTFGHQVGDDVLCEVATRLKQIARKTDIIGRWGGEEFMVICRGSGSSGARALANRMRRAVELHPFKIGTSYTCSFGVAAFDGAQGVDTMLREADNALYRAKAAGRNRVGVCKPQAIPTAGLVPAAHAMTS